MLLANETVGRKILETFPYTACLRRHPEPTQTRFKPLLAALETKDLSLDLDSNKARYLSRSAVHIYGIVDAVDVIGSSRPTGQSLF